MPTHDFTAPDDTPLFAEDDPLSLTLKGIGEYRCTDRGNLPIETATLSPGSTPMSYMIALLAKQVIPEVRDEFARELTKAVEEDRTTYAELIDATTWLRETREAAEKGTLARVVKRPTKAPRRSTPS